jgi:hypothetical protein
VNKDDLACHLGVLIRLQTMVEVEARRLGIDVERHSHAITDKLRDHKHRKDQDENQQARG